MKITAKRIKKRWIAGGIVIVAAAVGIALFVKAKGSKDTVNAGSGQQSTVQLLKQDLVESISATGAFESATNKSVTSTATNLTVKKVLVAVGDTVQKGDSLVKFDQSDLEDAYADAKDNLSNTTTSANAEVTNAKKQLSNAQTTYSDSKTSSAASVKKTKASLQTLKKTIRSLKDKIKVAKDAARKTALQQELSQAREQLTQAQEKYEQAVSNQTSGNRQNQSSVDSAKTAVEQAETNRTKQIKEAQKQVKEAKENLDNCAVTAPVSGTVTSLSVEEGDTYSGGTLLQIQDTQSFVITTSVDEYDISDVKVGQRVVILTDATDNDELEGKVTFVAPSTDSSGSTSTEAQGQSSGTAASSSDGYEVKIKVTSSDDRIKLGMTAKCSIVKKEASDVYAVPYDAVHKENGESYILVKDGDSTSKVTVTTGMETDYYIEVQGDDLQEGLQVVIPTDKTDSSSDSNKQNSTFGGFGGMGGTPDGSTGNKGDRGGMNGSKGGSGGMGGPGGGQAPSK